MSKSFGGTGSAELGLPWEGADVYERGAGGRILGVGICCLRGQVSHFMSVEANPLLILVSVTMKPHPAARTGPICIENYPRVLRDAVVLSGSGVSEPANRRAGPPCGSCRRGGVLPQGGSSCGSELFTWSFWSFPSRNIAGSPSTSPVVFCRSFPQSPPGTRECSSHCSPTRRFH